MENVTQSAARSGSCGKTCPEAAAIGMLFVAIAASLALLARRVIVQVGRLQE